VQLTAASKCAEFSSQISPSAKCEVNLASGTVKLMGIFPDSSYTDKNLPLSFQVTNVRNPRSVRPSTYFQIYTMDSAGYAIEASEDSAFVEMQKARQLTLANIKLKSSVVGA